MTRQGGMGDPMTPTEALQWLAEIFEEPPGSLTPQTPRSAVKAWDSLGVLTLMARCDEDLGLLLSDEELQQMRSIGDVLAILEKHGRLH